MADYIDLLDSKVCLQLKINPSLLRSLITRSMVVIDEVQRIPEAAIYDLLDLEIYRNCSPPWRSWQSIRQIAK